MNKYFNIYKLNMNLNKKIILSLFVSTICSYTWVFAAWVDHFEVDFTPTTAKVWESLDLTIEAVDKNNKTIVDYKWTILIFSESDKEAELPSALEENTYTFKTADQWKIKFENSVIFKSPWLQDIHIYDLNDDSILWVAEAQISEDELTKNLDISIVSPEDGLTIGKNTISVSWMTQKNYKVKIIVNWKDEYTTTSNNEWIFEKSVEKLINWENTFKAQVLDAKNKVVGESKIVKLKVELDSLNIKSVTLNPEKVDPEASYEVEMIANPGLTEASVIVNDTLAKLKETKPGIYTTKIYAPKVSWVYKVDAKIKDELWHEKTELWAASLTVNEVELKAATEVKEPVIAVNTGVTCDINKEYPITWLKLVELKTKSILTWNKIEWAESYNVYKKLENWELELIQNVTDATFEVEITWDKIKYDYFAVKAVAKNNCWNTYEWLLSDATKIKTGPELIILLILSLFIWWFTYIVKRKNA